MISNFRKFYIFYLFIFKFFFTNFSSQNFCLFIWPLLFICNFIFFFLKLIIFIARSLKDSQNFHTIFTSKYIMLIFYIFKWWYCRHWKTCPHGNKTSWWRRNYISLYFPATSQVCLKWNTQRRLSGTSPSRLSGMSPRRLIGTSWWRFKRM